jgi:hypothetical protein
MLATISP